MGGLLFRCNREDFRKVHEEKLMETKIEVEDLRFGEKKLRFENGAEEKKLRMGNFIRFHQEKVQEIISEVDDMERELVRDWGIDRLKIKDELVLAMLERLKFV